MKIGIQFNTGFEEITLWTSAGKKDQKDACIQSVSLSSTDTEISQCTVTFTDPSYRFQRCMLAKVIAEPTPLDQNMDLLRVIIWVQDPRYGYDPLPMFVGLPLDVQFKAGAPDEMTVTIHDFSRLQNIERDLQDYQNLTDGEIALTLYERLNQSVPGVIKEVIVDQEELRKFRTSNSSGAVRRWNASLLDPKALMTKWEKLQAYAKVLGVKVSRGINEEGKLTLYFSPIGGDEYEPEASKSYKRGDGEVLSFSVNYTPPSTVMTRNVMDRRFDSYLEAWRLERVRCGTKIRQDGIIASQDGRPLTELEVVSLRSVIDPKTGKPLSSSEYTAIQEPVYNKNVKALGWYGTSNLKAFELQIASRAGVFAPTSSANPNAEPVVGSNGVSATPTLTVQENGLGQGSLFWRFTGKLGVRMNPYLTTTDYLRIEGYGLWDGVYAIRSITHDLSDTPKTTFDLTFGAPVRLSQ